MKECWPLTPPPLNLEKRKSQSWEKNTHFGFHGNWGEKKVKEDSFLFSCPFLFSLFSPSPSYWNCLNIQERYSPPPSLITSQKGRDILDSVSNRVDICKNIEKKEKSISIDWNEKKAKISFRNGFESCKVDVETRNHDFVGAHFACWCEREREKKARGERNDINVFFNWNGKRQLKGEFETACFVMMTSLTYPASTDIFFWWMSLCLMGLHTSRSFVFGLLGLIVRYFTTFEKASKNENGEM